MVRAISDKLKIKLENSGILEAVKAKEDLALFLRGNYATVYYKTLQILIINSASARINEKYLHPELKNEKNARLEKIEIPGKYGKNWFEYFDYARQKIDEYQKGGKEKEYQQELIRQNRFANSDDYQIIDVEYAQNSIIPNGENKRFDAVAIYRVSENMAGLAFIELKVGNGAVYSKTSGVSDHLRSAGKFYAELIRKNKENDLYDDLDEVIKQLHELELLPAEIKISRKIKPQMIFAMADFKIAKHKEGLDEVISAFLKSEDDGYPEAKRHYEILFSDLSAEKMMTAENMVLRFENLKTPEEAVEQIKNERGKK